MSNFPTQDRTLDRPTMKFTETKAALKTTEFYVFLVVSIAVLVASAVTDNGDDGQGFGAEKAWMLVAFLAIGYMISRGIAKAASRRSDRD